MECAWSGRYSSVRLLADHLVVDGQLLCSSPLAAVVLCTAEAPGLPMDVSMPTVQSCPGRHVGETVTYTSTPASAAQGTLWKVGGETAGARGSGSLL